MKVTVLYDEETEEYIGGIEQLSGDIADLTKTASKTGGISLFTDESKTEYKSTTQLLRDISEIYDELTDKQQAGLLEKLAGKRQGQMIAAIINNFDTVEKSLETMTNSAGSAMREMDIIEQSLEFKLNALKETATGVFQNLFQTDDMGVAIDTLKNLLEIIDSLTEKIGLFNTIIVSAGIVKGIMSISSAMKTLGTTGVSSLDDLFLIAMEAFPNASKMVTNFTGALSSGEGIIAAFKGGLKGLWGVIAAHPVLATVAALTALSAIFNKVAGAAKETSEAADEAFNKASEKSEKIENENQQVSELIEKYKELKSSDYQDSNTRSEIVSIQEQITSLVGQQADNIDLVNGKLDSELAKLKEIEKTNAQKAADKSYSAYNAAKKSSNKAVGTESDGGFFGLFETNGLDYVGKIETEIANELSRYIRMFNQNAGVGFENPFSPTYKINLSAPGMILGSDNEALSQMYGDITTAEGKVKLIQDMIEQIENIEGFNYSDSDFYNSLVAAKDHYQDYVDKQKSGVQDLLSKVTSALYIGDDDLSKIKVNSIDSYEEYYQELLKKVSENEYIQNALSSGDITETDVKDYVQSYMSTLDEISDYYDEWSKSVGLDKIKEAFGKSSGIQDSSWNIAEQRLNKFNNWINNLSDKDKKIVYQISCDTDTAEYTLEDWQNELINYKHTVDEISQDVSSVLESTQSLISGISSAKDVLSSQSTGTSLSLEDFDSDELKDYTSALEYHNGVLKLNAEKVREIIKAKSEEQIETNNTNKAIAQSKYLQNAAQIEKLRQKIKDKNFEQDESKKSIKNEINTLLDENSTLKASCDSYDLMTASLQEATDAYHNWLNAQSALQSGDMFDDALDAVNRINETLNDSDSEYYGRVGRSDYQMALELIIPDSIDSSDEKAVNSYLKSIYDIFTYDENGNRAGLNIENFCEKAVDKGLMVFDKKTDSYKIAGKKTMEDFAEGLKLSMPVVQAAFGEMEEFGGQFSWADEAPKTIGDLGISANEAAESLRQMKKYTDLDIRLDVSEIKGVDEVDTVEKKVSTLQTTIKEMKHIKAKAKVDSSEYEYANQVIEYCITLQQSLSQPVVMRVDTSAISDRNAEAIGLIQEFQRACNDLDLKKALGVDTSDAEAKVQELAGQVKCIDTSILAQLNLDTSSIENLRESVQNIGEEQLIKIGIDSSAIDGFTDADKTATVKYDKDTTEIDSYNPKDLERTVTYHLKVDAADSNAKKILNSELTNSSTTSTTTKTTTSSQPTTTTTKTTTGSHGVNGTANANGTAKAGGNWGSTYDDKTLVGELGREIVVDPHTGRWYTVGDNGAEFVNIPKGAIVFNHKQTESLLANGYVAGRASALVSGTAMVTGGIGSHNASTSTKSGGNSTSNYGKSSNNKDKNKNKSDKSAKDFEETFDWIEVVIDRIERAISKLDLKANSVYKSWSTRNKSLTKEISKVTKEINVQQQGYNKYINQANSVGLSKSWRKRVQKGEIDIDTIKNEKLADKIKEYQQWYRNMPLYLVTGGGILFNC